MMGGRDWSKTALAWVASTAALRGNTANIVVRVEGRGPKKRPCKKHWRGLHFLSSLFRQHTLSAQLGSGSIY
jgi:hypothetical protein